MKGIVVTTDLEIRIEEFSDPLNKGRADLRPDRRLLAARGR